MPTGDVEITVLDGGGAVVVPSSSVQAVIGTSSSGTAAQVVATRNINTLISTFGYGPLVEAAAMTIAAGGTALCVKATSNTAGAASAVSAFATGTSVVTASGTPVDSYLIKFYVVAGGTRGTAGITFKVSLDAGRTYGPVTSLGTATTYVIPNTGVTLNFGAGTMVAGESVTLSTTEPLWSTGGIQSCLSALQASSYAISGWGSMHIVGKMSGSNASTVQGYLNTLKAGKIFTRAIVGVEDVAIPVAYGGLGDTEAGWMDDVLTDYSSTTADRLCVCAGHYNIPSRIMFLGTLPRYRRSLAYALASRQVQIQPQRHAGRVKDGPILEIVTAPATDATDGFVYHDERLNPGFDQARMTSAWTRVKKRGWWFKNPNLMSAIGSVFTLLPLGSVMDIACEIVNQKGVEEINEDVRVNKNGTITDNDAIAIEKSIGQAIKDNMLAKNMISDYEVVVDRSNNVLTTSTVNITVTIWARGYVLQENITIGFGTTIEE